ncbi:MAG: ABC transporter substrate-binding protein, partial [Acidimicrobiia bacterium]
MTESDAWEIEDFALDDLTEDDFAGFTESANRFSVEVMPRATPFTPELLRIYLGSPDTIRRVHLIRGPKGNILGYSTTSRDAGETNVHILRAVTSVAPPYRRQGMGTHLIRHVAGIAVDMRRGYLQGEAWDTVAAGIAFAESLGGDSGDTNQDIANPEVDRLIALDADAIIGAASSAVSKLVIDKITTNNIIHFSPANTSPDFTTYDDNGLYFRTAPSDLLQGKVLADQVAGEGNETVAVLYRQESYGQGLADAFKENFEAAGGTVEPFTAYAVDTENFDAEVDAMVAAGTDAVVVIGFAESANILTTMNERGIGPLSETNVWGVDGNIGGIGAELADPGIISGMKGTEPSVDLS